MLKKRTVQEGGATFGLRHRVFRALWQLTWFILARWTPPFMWRWRRFILICFGAKIGLNCDIRGTAKIWYPPNLEMAEWTMLADGVICYNVAKIEIGHGSLISQRAHLCAASHDINDSDFLLRPAPIIIGKQCWIAAEAFVGPGVKLDDGVVLGARAAAFRDLQEWAIYRGNPAEFVKDRPKQSPMQQSLR